jgi:hypothetical protein
MRVGHDAVVVQVVVETIAFGVHLVTSPSLVDEDKGMYGVPSYIVIGCLYTIAVIRYCSSYTKSLQYTHNPSFHIHYIQCYNIQYRVYTMYTI